MSAGRRDQRGTLLRPSHAALWEASGGAVETRRTDIQVDDFLSRLLWLMPPAVLKHRLPPPQLPMLIAESYESNQTYRAQLVVVDAKGLAAAAGTSLAEIERMQSLPPNQWALLAFYRELDQQGSERLLAMKRLAGSFE